MKNKFPTGWSEGKVQQIVDHYEAQSEDEAALEDETALAVEETLMQVPVELVADVRAMIAKQQMEH